MCLCRYSTTVNTYQALPAKDLVGQSEAEAGLGCAVPSVLCLYSSCSSVLLPRHLGTYSGCRYVGTYLLPISRQVPPY